MQIGKNEQQNKEKELDAREPKPLIIHVQRVLSALNIHFSKTKSCQHEGGCLSSLIIQSIKRFILGYLVRTGTLFMFSIRKLLTKPTILLQILANKKSLDFALFLSTFTLVFKAVICLLRRVTKKDKEKFLYLVAGFIAGVTSIGFLEKKTRQSLGLFLFVRALDASYHTLVEKQIIPKSKYFYIFVYSVMMSITGYCYMNQPGCLSLQTRNFYDTFIQGNVNDMLMRKITIERKNNQLLQRGLVAQKPEEYIKVLGKLYKNSQK